MIQTRRIAIALEIDQPYPHHQQVLAGIQQYAAEHEGWVCLIDEHPGHHARRRGAHYPRYDGVIARASPALQRRMKRMGVPLVNTHFQTARDGLPGVYSDPDALGRIAAEHLIERGFRRLSVMRDNEHKHSSAISQGFFRCAAEHETECHEVYFPERQYRNADHWLDLEKFLSGWLDTVQPPVGMCTEGAAEARLLIQLAEARGLNVPQDIAVLSQHNEAEIVEVPPQITALDENCARVGYEAARMLDHLMQGRPAPAKPVFVPARGIIARESTDYFAVEDQVVAAALRYIAGHLAEPLRVDQVADQIMVSPRSLQKRFSEALGRGVSEEIRRLRLELAKRLLAEADHPISAIARRAGFGSADLMNQVFRRELGMTPSAYRKQVLGERASS